MIDIFSKSLFDDMTAGVALGFLLVVFLAAFKFLLQGDSSDRGLQKIIGGLGVFLVAIISRDPWVFALSIFVGGLIIASENFMIFLAAILTGKGEEIPKILTTWSDASLKEVEQKEEEEFIDMVFEEPDLFSNDDENLKVSDRAEKTKKIESLVHQYFVRMFSSNYQSSIKLSNQYGEIVMDGLIEVGGQIKYLIEIKYHPTTKRIIEFERSVQRFYNQLIKYHIDDSVVLAVVSDEVELEEAISIRDLLAKKFSFNSMFFKLENDVLTPVLMPVFLNEYNKKNT